MYKIQIKYTQIGIWTINQNQIKVMAPMKASIRERLEYRVSKKNNHLSNKAIIG